MRYTKIIRIAALALLAMLALTACVGNGTPTQTAAPQTSASATQTTTAAAPQITTVAPQTTTTTSQTTANAAQTTVTTTQTTTTAPQTTAAASRTTAAAPQTTSAAPQTTAEPAARSDTLVVYFSATGTTKGVAEKLAAVTGADLYEIVPAEPYSEADLNWHDKNSRTTHEQNDKSVRPAIAGEPVSLEGYTTIYVGFPIWWGEEPRILDTFVESYDFTGITLIPFCTSGGSGIGRSGPNMEALAGTGTWLAGARHSGNISEEELKTWIESLH